MKVLTLKHVGPGVLLGITLLMSGCGGSGDSLDLDSAKVGLSPIDVSSTGASTSFSSPNSPPVPDEPPPPPGNQTKRGIN